MLNTSTKNLCIIGILALLMTLPWISLKPFYSKGEPREALTALAMQQQDNWILPRRYGNEFPTKPPAFHWMIASVAAITGEVNEFSSRLPSVLMALAVVLGLYSLLKENPQHAFTSCLVLLGSIEWHRSTMTARVDMALAGFIFFAFINIYYWHKKRCSGFPVILNLMIAGAVLTKGPVGIILPSAVLVLFLFLKKYTYLQIIVAALKLLPCLIFPALWYLLAYNQVGKEFLDVVISENLGRVTGKMQGEYGAHAHSIFYLYGTLLAGLLPWTFLLFSSLKKPKEIINKCRNFNYKSLNDIELLALIVCIIVSVFYSIPASKRSVYLLPIYPFLAIFLSHFLLHLEQSAPAVLKNYWKIIVATIYLLIASSIIFSIFREQALLIFTSNNQNRIDFYQGLAFPLLPIILSAVFLSFIIYMRNRIKYFYALPWVLALVVANSAFLPALAKLESPNELANIIERKKQRVFSFGERMYTLDFFLNGNLQESESSNLITGDLIVFDSVFLKDFNSFIKYKGINCKLINTAALNSKRKTLLYEVTNKVI